MKRAIIISVFLLMPSLVWAAEPASSSITIDNLVYITGIQKVDEIKIRDPKRIPRYKAWFEIDANGAALTRVDRGTLDGGQDDKEVIVSFFYFPEVTALYYGQDAIKKAEEGLPTGLKKIRTYGRSMIFGGSSYVSLPKYMRHKNMVPMIIFYQRDGTTTSLVVRGPPAQMKKLYTTLSARTGLKVKPPQVHP